MVLQNITKNHATILKNILLNEQLTDKISLKFNAYEGIHIKINSTYSEYWEENHYLCLLNTEESDEDLCMKINNRYSNLYMFVGDWGYDYDIPDMHISLYSGCSKLGNHFAQIDLSQAIEDNNNIYLVKKISKLAGKGAIARLGKGLKKDRETKIQRRDKLVEELKANIIDYHNEEWMCVSAIKKANLRNAQTREKIKYKLLYDFIKYAFTIEDIINDKL